MDQYSYGQDTQGSRASSMDSGNQKICPAILFLSESKRPITYDTSESKVRGLFLYLDLSLSGSDSKKKEGSKKNHPGMNNFLGAV
jgi:hypothetical protein